MVMSRKASQRRKPVEVPQGEQVRIFGAEETCQAEGISWEGQGCSKCTVSRSGPETQGSERLNHQLEWPGTADGVLGFPCLQREE